MDDNAGVEHVGGDMFASIPKGDAIFMKVRFNLPNLFLSCEPLTL